MSAVQTAAEQVAGRRGAETMRAAVFERPGRIALQERRDPGVRANDAIVRVTMTTICGTDVQESAKLLRSLVERAVLAPSSHNTQPWLFRIAGNRLELYADRTRALSVNDPHDRGLTISCAAALLNARIAAGHAGARLDIELRSEGDESDLLARATLAGDGAADEALFAAIAERRTYRKDFEDRDVPTDVLAALARAAVAESGRLQILDTNTRTALVELVAEGDRRQFADPYWRRELAAWMHPRRRGEGLVVPELAAPATRVVVSHFDLGRRLAGRDANLAARSPVLAVLATDGNAVPDWLAAGQALERVLLTAAAAGLQAPTSTGPSRSRSCGRASPSCSTAAASRSWCCASATRRTPCRLAAASRRRRPHVATSPAGTPASRHAPCGCSPLSLGPPLAPRWSPAGAAASRQRVRTTGVVRMLGHSAPCRSV
jgi:hypothetical protein